MSALSISNALVSCELISEESLTSSQLTLSCTFQSFFIEATSRSALLSLALGQGCAAVVQSQGYRLLSPLFHPKTAQVLATAASYITEGICFNTAAELGRSGRFTIGSPGECLYGITTIAVCKGMGKGVLSHNAVVRNIVQNSALMTVDILFEKCQLIEQRNLSILDRYFSCQLTSFRMEISATLLANACPTVATLKATQELDYTLRKSRETLPTSKENGRFFDPLQDMFAPALAGNNGIIIRKSNLRESWKSIFSKAQILKMSTLQEEILSSNIEPLSHEQVSDPQETFNQQLKKVVHEVGLDPDTPTGQFGFEILSRRIAQEEWVVLLEKDFGERSRHILQNALSIDLASENGKNLALLLLACAEKPFSGRISSDLWFKWFNDGIQLTSGPELEKLEDAIQLGMRYASEEYGLEIKKVETALMRIQMLTSLFQEIKIPSHSIHSIGSLFYRTLCSDVQRIDAFNRHYTFWRFTSDFEILPILKKIGTAYEESSFWVEDPTQVSDETYQRMENIAGEVVYNPPFLDKDPKTRIQGAEILIRLRNEVGFQQTDLPRFMKLARDHADNFFKMTHIEETTTGPRLIVTDKEIQFTVKILLEGRVEAISTPILRELSEANTEKHSQFRRNKMARGLRSFLRWITSIA